MAPEQMGRLAGLAWELHIPLPQAQEGGCGRHPWVLRLLLVGWGLGTHSSGASEAEEQRDFSRTYREMQLNRHSTEARGLHWVGSGEEGAGKGVLSSWTVLCCRAFCWASDWGVLPLQTRGGAV